jgi:hypothetical protein
MHRIITKGLAILIVEFYTLKNYIYTKIPDLYVTDCGLTFVIWLFTLCKTHNSQSFRNDSVNSD